ncbi:aminofutalosine synthase MqnE [Helicobacter saguini]|uniref:Aminofutalosine synthase MqnE n=1 Tax=Helicobacter saguini TaxID=1548018 RepID=A0A347VNM1_9HELI|nr:aminofutalosine synthase MqnE [Helicobacter saguini]MWV61711.1 aminofutalosine synthase MqnE [Helicobacter saguini]MWV67617.1 aminofutalosine synthase MqnE [Helicobacter saguini]MWV69968.1 aminofutalosine synthase MqnE [Helicobacter saguini]MWV72818.1 aminofutalosine synthase MqnE [Helicobacter saguini]TLD92362.1 aminofutalosine synthase MqnE [Helicobacter saguini]
MDLLDSVLNGKIFENFDIANAQDSDFERLSKELAKLYDYDIFTLGDAADSIRRKMYQNKVFFNMNRHINPTNICADTCKFCAFSASRKNPNPYDMSISQVVAECVDAYSRGAKEVHIVSAHHPEHSYSHNLEMFKAIKKAVPKLHVKAMGAAEIDYLTRKFELPLQKVLDDLVESGVDSLPGGGAEIFHPSVRKKLCHGKADAARWLEIHKAWHKMGRMSNATMLFGHIEERWHRIEHILRLRFAQTSLAAANAKSGGFNAFIPLLYQRYNNFLKAKDAPTAQEILKTISIARILLDNIPHIKAYWASLSFNLAIVAQEFGSDDMDGTIEKESIQSAAGAKSRNGVSKSEMISQIQNAGFIPVERDSLYNELRVFESYEDSKSEDSKVQDRILAV